eukprot:SAG31_NODE_12253_length_955_cov_1.267523_1_plen_193_part_10
MTEFYMRDMVDQNAKHRFLEQRQQLENYLYNSVVCRHTLLCAHFGEKGVPVCGNRCDACIERNRAAMRDGSARFVDLTVFARQLLQAVHVTGERFGLGTPIAVLRGSLAQPLIEKFGSINELTRLSCFGRGKSMPETFWKGLAGVLCTMDRILVKHFSTTGFGWNSRSFTVYKLGINAMPLLADEQHSGDGAD